MPGDGDPFFYCLWEHIQGPVSEGCGYEAAIRANEKTILRFWQVEEMILLFRMGEIIILLIKCSNFLSRRCTLRLWCRWLNIYVPDDFEIIELV